MQLLCVEHVSEQLKAHVLLLNDPQHFKPPPPQSDVRLQDSPKQLNRQTRSWENLRQQTLNAGHWRSVKHSFKPSTGENTAYRVR